MGRSLQQFRLASVIRFYHDNDISIYHMITAGVFEGGVDFQVVKLGVMLRGFSDSDRTQKATVEAESWEAWYSDEADNETAFRLGKFVGQHSPMKEKSSLFEGLVSDLV